MRAILGFLLGLTLAGCLAAAPAKAQDFNGFATTETPGLFGIFDEVRVGGLTSIQPDYDSGVVFSGQLYFKPFGSPSQNYLANTVLRPRVHIGGNLALWKEGVDQVYAGLTWHFPIWQNIFAEASFGGTWVNGDIDKLRLGCEWLFHESVGLGIDLNERWRVVGVAEHSSHANLCSDHNAGVTHAGAYIGYRF